MKVCYFIPPYEYLSVINFLIIFFILITSGIIEDLEDKVGLQDQESVTRDKSYTSQILQLQQQTREMLEKEDLRKLEYQNNMQDECRRLTIEVC